MLSVLPLDSSVSQRQLLHQKHVQLDAANFIEAEDYAKKTITRPLSMDIRPVKLLLLIDVALRFLRTNLSFSDLNRDKI